MIELALNCSAWTVALQDTESTGLRCSPQHATQNYLREPQHTSRARKL